VVNRQSHAWFADATTMRDDSGVNSGKPSSPTLLLISALQ